MLLQVLSLARTALGNRVVPIVDLGKVAHHLTVPIEPLLKQQLGSCLCLHAAYPRETAKTRYFSKPGLTIFGSAQLHCVTLRLIDANPARSFLQHPNWQPVA